MPHPIFFKKLPKSDETRPNATYLRPMGDVAGHPACEIHWHSEKWIVRESEALTPELACKETAKAWNAEIEQAKSSMALPKRSEIAKVLCISESTLVKRLKFIQNHLPQPTSSPPLNHQTR